MTILFLNGTADGPSPEAHESTGGKHVLILSGVIDSATLTVEVRSPNDPNAMFIPLPNGDFTEITMVQLDYIPSGYEVRAVIAGATASTDLFCEVRT